jgi:hypothetical protein
MAAKKIKTAAQTFQPATDEDIKDMVKDVVSGDIYLDPAMRPKDSPPPAGIKEYWLEIDVHTSQTSSAEPDIAARRAQVVLKIRATNRTNASRVLESILQGLVDQAQTPIAMVDTAYRKAAESPPVQATPQYELRNLIVPCTVCGAAIDQQCDMSDCKVDGAVVHNARYIAAAVREKELVNGVQPTVVVPAGETPSVAGLDF